MKKFLTISMALLLTAGMVSGCTTSKSAEEQTTEDKSATEVSVDYAKGLNEDGTLSDVNAADYVTLCDYSAINISKDEITVEDSEVQSQIDSIMENYKKTKEVTDRAIADGDVANIDYVGKVDGEEFEGGSAEGYDLTIGSGTFIEGFEDQLIGHKPGEKVEVKVTFPENYTSEELAGKDAVFETTINYISESEDQELTDKFVKDNLQATYGYKSVKNMKKQIKEGLQNDKKTDFVWNYMLENSTFQEIPEELVNERIDIILDGLRADLSSQGYTMDDYLSAYGYEDEDALREVYYETCENTVKVFLVADVIASEQNLSVSEDKIQDYFGTEDYSVYTSYYTEPYINRVVLNDVVVKNILENAKIK